MLRVAATLAAVALLLPAASHAFIRKTPVPILMYHVIAPAPAIAPYPDLYVKPSDFVSQMRWLKRNRIS